MESEKIICEVSPSQIRNFEPFVFSALAVILIAAIAIATGENLVLLLLALPLGYFLWNWIRVRSVRLRLTDQRLIIREGVFNKTTNETELYRVRDSSIEEPFFYRLFGCGNLHIFTTDEAEATILLAGYKKPHWLKDQIRNYSEICRQRKRWGNDNVLIHDHADL